jgi:hypothetical protein
MMPHTVRLDVGQQGWGEEHEGNGHVRLATNHITLFPVRYCSRFHLGPAPFIGLLKPDYKTIRNAKTELTNHTKKDIAPTHWSITRQQNSNIKAIQNKLLQLQITWLLLHRP